mgnify:FL=1
MLRTKLVIVALLVLVLSGARASNAQMMTSTSSTFTPELFAGLKYRTVGPSRGGRVTAVAGHRAQPSTFYMGATGGGVWKTTDYGKSWHNISDGYFATGSIGAIRVAESDPNVIYVSTGSDGLRSNVIIGKGVYKSVDAGVTWEHLGLENTGNSGAVLIHPANPDLVYVAAIGNPFAPNPERGVYRSADGGQTWDLVLFVSERTGAVDLEFTPDNPEEIYATMWLAERKPWTIISGGFEGGVYKTVNGGDSWTHLANGLPNGLRGKADLAVSNGDPDRVYVLIEAPGNEGGVYRSDDRGETWRQVSDFAPIRNRSFYYCNLEAHPTNPDVLWGMAEGQWMSQNGGESWTRVSTPHGDNHDMWINPDQPELMIQSNDGGANVSLDGGVTWSTQNNQPTAELYQVDVSDEFPYRLFAGQQDNSTISVPSLVTQRRPGGHVALWESHGGCETGPVVPKPSDPAIVYANCKGRFGLYNRRTGQEQQYYVGFWNIYGHNPRDLAFRFQRVAPIHVSPHNPNRVYHASQFVHVTEDGGENWNTISPDLTAFSPETQVVSGSPITIDVTGEEHFAVIYDIQESPHEAGVIWVGANDGPIHVTRDNGATWTDVTPPDIGPHGRGQNIEESPHDPATAYATLLRYQVGDFAPYAFKTEDYGQSWVRITTGENGVPVDHPVRVVREDPDRQGLLYAGTEFGLFVSFDDGVRWQPLQLNLPVTPVSDIKVVNQDLLLSTMGRGFWILDDLTPLHELSRQIASSDTHLFAVRDTYRLYGVRRFGGEPRPDEPRYPDPGANIDYYLASDAANEVRLEILDDTGRLVRRFSSESTPEQGLPSSVRMGEWHLEEVGTAQFPKTAGMHRFVWDLRHAGPWDPLDSRSGRNGPMVVPGIFQARLTVGGWSNTQNFEVMIDPRVVDEGTVSQANIEAQVRLGLEVRDALSDARFAAMKLDEARDGAPDQLLALLQEIREALVTAPIRYSRPVIIDQLSYLYSNLIRADQQPGQDAFNRYQELNSMLSDYIGRLEQLLQTNNFRGEN